MVFRLKRSSVFVQALCAWKTFLLFSLPFVTGTFNAVEARADQGITYLSTGSGGPLLTESLPFFVNDLGQPVQIRVDFGFGTDETFGPGTIFDSFTLSLADAANSSVWMLANIDAGGIVVEPATPGTLPLDEGALTISTIPSPLTNADFANLFSFSMTATIPDELLGTDAFLHFDLFDNQNGDASRGWFSNFSVVPEAATSSLVLIGLAVISLLGRGKPRSDGE